MKRLNLKRIYQTAAAVFILSGLGFSSLGLAQDGSSRLLDALEAAPTSHEATPSPVVQEAQVDLEDEIFELKKQRIEAKLNGEDLLALTLKRRIEQLERGSEHQEVVNLETAASVVSLRSPASIPDRALIRERVTIVEHAAEETQAPEQETRLSYLVAEMAIQLAQSRFMWMLMMCFMLGYIYYLNKRDDEMVSEFVSMKEKSASPPPLPPHFFAKIAEDPQFHHHKVVQKTLSAVGNSVDKFELVDEKGTKNIIELQHPKALAQKSGKALTLGSLSLVGAKKRVGNYICFDQTRQAWVIVREDMRTHQKRILAELISQCVVSGALLDEQMDATKNYCLEDGIHWKETELRPRLMLNLNASDFRI